MALNFKVAVLRARHDSSYPTISDQACSEMLIANPRGTAVLQYWTQVTGGHLDFTGTVMFPWVTIDVGDPKLGRGDQFARAMDATRKVTNDLFIAYDGFVLLVHPGAVQVAGQGQVGMDDAGATGVDGARKCAVLHYTTRDHTFMCHEVGHVLGFEHSFGLRNTGMDWDQTMPWVSDTEYGDPYDIMSSAAFGQCDDPALGITTSAPEFPIPVPAGWAVSSTQPGLLAGGQTTTAGPAPALAHVDWRYPEALGRAVAHVPVPTYGQAPVHVRLHASDLQAGTRLVALHAPGEDKSGVGRIYLEYRRAAGWDAGLDTTGSDLARQAVVAHTVGLAYNGVRLWYRGRILVPLSADTDMQVQTTPLSVRAVGVSADQDWVDLDIVYGSERGVSLAVRRSDEIASSTVTSVMHTPCGDPVREVNRLFRTTMGFQPSVFGFDSPTPVTWTVAGKPPQNLVLDTPDGLSPVKAAIDPRTQELTLTSTRGHHYSVEVVASVTEPGGKTHSATSVFDPTGSYVGTAPEDQGLIDKCWEKWAKSKRLQPYERLRDVFGRGRLGRVVLDDDRLRDVLVEELGKQRYDELEPPAREALEQLVRLGLR